MEEGAWKKRLATVKQTAVENGLHVILAVMFWSIIFLLVLFATAEGKDSPFTAFFTAFGAVGQTFFAWMVWRLSQQQFRFSQKVAKRQAQIDTYTLRVELFDQFVEVRKKLTVTAIDETEVFKLWKLSSRIERLFSKATQGIMDEFGTKAMDLAEAKEDEANAAANGDAVAASECRAKRIEINKEVRRLNQAAFSALQSELRIDSLDI